MVPVGHVTYPVNMSAITRVVPVGHVTYPVNMSAITRVVPVGHVTYPVNMSGFCQMCFVAQFISSHVLAVLNEKKTFIVIFGLKHKKSL
jgi:hypothetical protein